MSPTGSNFLATISEASIDIEEYGIVVLPDTKCVKELSLKASDSANIIKDLSLLEQNRHITLYQAAFTFDVLTDIKAKLAIMDIKPFVVTFMSRYSKSNIIIMGLNVQSPSYLKNLYGKVLKPLYHIANML